MPFLNGKFYMNPAQGRALERARANPAISHPAEQQSDAHWVTINGHRVLIHDASKAARDKIAGIANKYNGNTNWAYSKRKDNFPPNTNKCNKFVYDVAREAGAEPTVISSDGKPRPPLAAEWADPNTQIANWRVLGENEAPEPGDVAARKEHFTDATGHSGIVVSVSKAGEVTAIAAHATKIGPDMSFQPGSKVYHNVFRRYEGG